MELAELRVFAPGASKTYLQGIQQAWHYAESCGITGPLRVPHFMAQLAHESDGFRTTEEYASGRAYEGRKDLGNTQPGDGPSFKGHGLIQVTGRANHREFTDWLGERLLARPNFETNPEKLKDFPWAFIAAVWFWQTRGLNALADKNDIRAITKKINGGYNGLDDRRAHFRKAVAVWGDKTVNPKGSSFAGTRAVKGAVGFLGGGLTLAGAAEQAEQASSLANAAASISSATGLPLWGLVLGVMLLGGIAYLIWDRRFIYQHEGL